MIWQVAAYVFCLSVLLQGADMDGYIVDKTDDKPLEMVNITLKSGNIGTTTDENGYFVLSGDFHQSDTVYISHIGYQKLAMTVGQIQESRKIILEPLSIMLKEVEVSGFYQKYQMENPADVQIIDQEIIIERAPGNLGELLRMEPSIQVRSASPGYQTVSIRGSSPEQVLVLYDGIPIRSVSDDIADISWIDVNYIGEIQVFKGSQSVMFGEGAIGGVLNLCSRQDSPYWLRFSGRLGNYHTRAIYFALDKQWQNWTNRYSLSIKNANYIDDNLTDDITTASAFHNFHSSYKFSDFGSLTLRGMVMDRFLSVIHSLDETDDERQIVSLQYEGNLWTLKNIFIQALYRHFGTGYMLYILTMPHSMQARFEKTDLEDRIKGIKAEQTLKKRNLTLSYGLQYYWADFESALIMDYIMPVGFDSLRDERHFQRESAGFYNIIKHQTTTGSRLLPVIDWVWSLRYDYAFTERYFDNPLYYYVDEKYNSDIYRALNYRIGLETRGESAKDEYRVFVNNGANVRFPSLYDVYLNDVARISVYRGSSLYPERVISSEIGAQWNHAVDCFGIFLNQVDIRLSLFWNSYLSKIYYIGVINALPVAANSTEEVDVNGVDMKIGCNIFAERLRFDVGGLWLDISNKALFPNKPSLKYQADVSYTHGNLSCRLRGFYEGSQTSLARLPGGATFFTRLNDRADVDIYLNYRFVWNKFDLQCGLIAMNVFSRENASLVYSYLNRIRTVQMALLLGFK
ncbi:MAG TPA: TonB-dependent receptor [Candidatus Marinimicrobia bacterium]|nr:TonB-dependent receptor [Candidatus Neomarinimicrobiota bacterium]